MIATLETLTHGLDIAGVGANAVLGGVKAREHRFDIVGFATLAITSGLGGGIIRDTLLQHGPPLALTDRLYLITAVAGALVAYLLRVHGRLWEHSYRFVDALALGCWAAAGAQLTLSDSLSWQAAVLLGTVTAVGGGVVRDVLLRDVPQIFGGNRLYATSAVLASIVLVLCHGLGLARLGILGGTVVGAGLCLISYQRGWSLPRRERSRNRVNRVNSLSTSALALWRTPVAVISGVLPRSPGQVTLAAAAVPTAARARPAGRPRRR